MVGCDRAAASNVSMSRFGGVRATDLPKAAPENSRQIAEGLR